MTKLCIIGAGSTVFTKNIVVDLLTLEKFKSMEIALMDIDEKRLDKTYEILEIISNKFLTLFNYNNLILELNMQV